MGFGVEYFYFERNDDGTYNAEELKSIKRKVGDPLDDVSLDMLAAKVLSQLARRDIWVQDIKIYEYKKKEITFKETKGGIVLKNRKFTLDEVSRTLQSEEIPEKPEIPDSSQEILRLQSQLEALQSSNLPAVVNTAKLPQRTEIFDPERDHIQAGLVRGKFTVGKKYPIFSEQRDPREQAAGRELPILYVTIDDTGKQVTTPGVSFRPMGGGLVGGHFESRPAGQNDGLVWSDIKEETIQDIRR